VKRRRVSDEFKFDGVKLDTYQTAGVRVNRWVRPSVVVQDDKIVSIQPMKNAIFALLTAVALTASPLELVSGGQPRGVVVVAASAGPLSHRAATLLVSRIERKTGAKLSIVGTLPASGPAVVIAAAGSRELTGVKAPTAQELGEEGFALIAQGERLYVVAKEGRGLIYGAGKILRKASYARGAMRAQPPLGVDKPAMGHRMLYLAIHVENYYEMQEARTIMREVVEDMALWGVNGVWVWFDQSQYNDPFEKGVDNADARRRWDKEKEVLRLAQDLGLKPGYTMSDNDLYRNQVTPEVKAPNTEKWSNFQMLACPSIPRAREITLRNKDNLARELAAAGVRLEMGCHFAYDTGGCLCDRCKPWVTTFLNLAKEVHETFRKYHPAMRSYMSDWHFTDQEARTAIDFFHQRKPAWFGGVFKDDRHPADRFATVPPGYPVLTFLEITEIGGWGTVGANPFPKRLVSIFGDLRRTGQDGYVAYSEGIYDDFNKAASARIAWDPAVTPEQLATEYANYFFDASVARDFTSLTAGMESAWTNPMGSWGQQEFVQGSEDATRVEKLALSIGARLSAKTRQSWRWQVFEHRARIGAAIADLGDREAFRDHVKAMARAGASRMAKRRTMEAKRARLEEYARLVVNLRDNIYKEPWSRYPPIIPGDWFMKGRTRLDYAAWVQLFLELGALADGVPQV
jgi:hypothetical protein